MNICWPAEARLAISVQPFFGFVFDWIDECPRHSFDFSCLWMLGNPYSAIKIRLCLCFVNSRWCVHCGWMYGRGWLLANKGPSFLRLENILCQVGTWCIAAASGGPNLRIDFVHNGVVIQTELFLYDCLLLSRKWQVYEWLHCQVFDRTADAAGLHKTTKRRETRVLPLQVNRRNDAPEVTIECHYQWKI